MVCYIFAIVFKSEVLKRALFFLFCVFLVSCSQNDSTDDVNLEDDDIGLNDDEIISVDEDAPVVSINGLNSEIEVETNISFSITDESTTTTRIFLNEQEIFSSSEREFEFTFNPYPYEVGSSIIRITSTDSEGNGFEEEFPVEIKHLLMEFEFGADEMASKDATWVFFNDADGALLEFYKPTVGSNKFYTDLIIEEDFVYYTFSQFDTDGGDIIHNLVNGSYKVGLGKVRKMNENSTVSGGNFELGVEIRNSESINGIPKFSAVGTNYRGFGQRGSNAPQTEFLNISFSFPETIFIYSPDAQNEPLFSYLYTTIDAEESDNIVLFENDFKRMSDSILQDIPAFDDNGIFRIKRFGYESDTDLALDTRHEIYNISLSNTFIPDSRILSLPILEALQFYSNEVDYRINGKTVFSEQFGNTLDFNPPNWTVTDFGSAEGTYYIDSGESTGVDYYLIRNFKRSGPISTSEVSKRFIWVYRTFENVNGRSITPILEFPIEITEELNDSFYTQEDLEIQLVTAVDFINIREFSEVADYFALGLLEFGAEERGYKSVQFPNEEFQTNKSSSMEKVEGSQKF